MIKSRQISLLTVIILVLIIALCGFAFVILWWFSHASYDVLVQKITHTLNRPDLTTLINTKLFPIEKYRLVYKFHWLLYIFVVALFLLLLYKRRFIENKITILIYIFLNASRSVFRFYASLTRTRILLVIIGCLAYVSMSLYLASIKPIIYDEAWGYQYYLKMPFYFSFLLFNTYPLNNLITHFFTYLPFSEVINIRLPSIFFGLLTILLFFYSTCRRVGFYWSVLALIFLVSSPVFSTYSYLSRGVSLALLFTVVAFHLLLRLMEHGYQRRDRLLFVLVNILGILTLPTFLLFTGASAVLLMTNQLARKQSIKQPLYDVTLAGIIAAVFYFPMLVTSGSATVFHNNRYDVNFADVFQESLTFLFGMSQLFFENKFFIFFLLIVGFIHVISSRKNLRFHIPAITCLSILLLVILFRFLLGNILPERSLSFLVIPGVLLIILCLRWASGTGGTLVKVGIGCIILINGAFVYYHTQRRFLAAEEDNQAKVVSKILLQNNIRNIYLQEDDFWTRLPMIEFYYSEKQAEIDVHTSLTSSTRYKAFNNLDQYDCIVQDDSLSNNISGVYHPIYRSKEFNVWKRKL